MAEPCGGGERDDTCGCGTDPALITTDDDPPAPAESGAAASVTKDWPSYLRSSVPSSNGRSGSGPVKREDELEWLIEERQKWIPASVTDTRYRLANFTANQWDIRNTTG